MAHKDKERAKAYRQQYYQEHKEEIKAKTIRWGMKLRFGVLFHYCNGYPYCVRCGIKDTELLCIDHIEGGGNKHRRALDLPSGHHFYLWLKRNDYPEGFQVLCYNCNRKKQLQQLREGKNSA